LSVTGRHHPGDIADIVDPPADAADTVIVVSRGRLRFFELGDLMAKPRSGTFRSCCSALASA